MMEFTFEDFGGTTGPFSWLFWFCTYWLLPAMLLSDSYQTEPSNPQAHMFLPGCTWHFRELLHFVYHPLNALHYQHEVRSIPGCTTQVSYPTFGVYNFFLLIAMTLCVHLKPTFTFIHYGQKGMKAVGDGSQCTEWKWCNYIYELGTDHSMKIKALKWQSPLFIY